LSADLVPTKLRWLAVAAGCSSIVFGPLALISPPLIVGAVIQPRARTSGKWLMWFGSILLSLVVVPIGTGSMYGVVKHPSNFPNGIFSLLMVLSFILVCWLDVAIVIDGLRSKTGRWVRGDLDWVVWGVAAALTAWCVWLDMGTVQAYRRLGSLRVDLMLTAGNRCARTLA